MDLVLEVQKAAYRYGLKPAEFWILTPYETKIWIEARTEGTTDQYKMLMWHAWHVAAFGRTKKMPDLKILLRKIGGEKPKQQSTKQMLKMAEMITGMMGGEDKRKKK